MWASPPCAGYSKAKTVGARKLDEVNAIVKRTLDVVHNFSPPCWMMENPQTGLLQDQGVVADLPYNNLDYRKYGMPYRKRTESGTTLRLGHQGHSVRLIATT